MVLGQPAALDIGIPEAVGCTAAVAGNSVEGGSWCLKVVHKVGIGLAVVVCNQHLDWSENSGCMVAVRGRAVMLEGELDLQDQTEATLY